MQGRQKKILLALVTGPHGIQGAVKLKTFTDSPTSLFNYPNISDANGHPCRLKLVRVLKEDMVIAILNDTKTRTDAEKLRGIELYVDRSDLPELEEDEFYHEDLLNVEVYDETSTKVGRVKAILNHGAGDFLEIITDTGNLLTIPFTKEAVPTVKRDQILINKAFLLGIEE